MMIYTVGELIEQLKAFNPDLPVIVTYDGRYAHTELEEGHQWLNEATTADLYGGYKPAYPCLLIDV